MQSHPSRLFFLMTLILGALLAISANSWFTSWMGLELNLLSFIPLLSSTSNSYETEAALKYFLIQALGSAVILLSALMNITYLQSSLTLILIALLLKMGAAPLHFWLPTVMQGTNWPQCFILLTLQKIAPMILVSYTLSSSLTLTMVTLSSICSSLTGGLGGLNQTFLRKILAYSSINHSGWMLASISFKKALFLNYFLIYTTISACLTLIFYFEQVFHINQFTSSTLSNPYLKFIFIPLMLSLGGLPPFLGFIPKLLVIQTMIEANQILWLTPLLFSALLTLFFYLRVTLSLTTLTSHKIHSALKPNIKNIFYLLSLINLLPLYTPLILNLPF